MEEKESTLKHNDEMGFLYKKCRLIKPYVISLIALVPEFMDALKSYTGTLDDNSVYEIIKKTYKSMMNSGNTYRTARDAMNKISRDVKGDSGFWLNDE